MRRIYSCCIYGGRRGSQIYILNKSFYIHEYIDFILFYFFFYFFIKISSLFDNNIYKLINIWRSILMKVYFEKLTVSQFRESLVYKFCI